MAFGVERNKMSVVTITREEYRYLQNREAFLTCLEAAGVDNWDGYMYASNEYRETHKEEE